MTVKTYTGPDPGSGTHRYIFKVYALDSKLDLPANSTKEDTRSSNERAYTCTRRTYRHL